MRSKTASVVPTAGRRPTAGVLLIFTGFLLFAFFGFGDNANAATHFDNLPAMPETADGLDLPLSTTGGYHNVAQSFTTVNAATSLNVTFDIYVSSGTPDDTDVSIQIYTDDMGSPDAPVSGWTGDVLDDAEINGSPQRFTRNVSGTALTNSTKYWIVFSAGAFDGGSGWYRIGGAGGDDVVGEEMQRRGSGPSWTAESGRDLQILVDDGAPPLSDPTLIVPADMGSVTEFPAEISGTCEYGPVSWNIITNPATGSIVTGGFAPCDPMTLTWEDEFSGVWNGEFTAIVYDDVGIPSETNDFTVAVSGNPTAAPPAPEEEFTDEDFGTLGNLLREVLRWLFVPSQNALNTISNLWGQVRLKPPIGYFVATADALGAFDQGTSSLELEGTDDLSTWFDPISDTLTTFIWLLAGVYTIKRISSLQI